MNRKLLRSASLICALLLGGAFAQGNELPSMYAGGSLKAGLLYDACSFFTSCGGLSYGASLHVGAHDLLAENAGARASFGVTLATSLTLFQLAADVLYEPMSGAQIAPYVGGGPRVGFMSRHTSDPSITMHDSFTFGAGIVGGARFAFNDELAAFAEAGLNFLATSGLAPSVAVGVDYSF